MTDKIETTPPPGDLDLERALIASCIRDGSEVLPRIVTRLNTSDFYGHAHRLIWNTILDIHRRGVWPDLATLTYEIKKRGILDKDMREDDYKDLVLFPCDPVLCEEYANGISELSRKRAAYYIAKDMETAARNGVASSDLISLVKTRLDAIPSGIKVSLFGRVKVGSVDTTPWLVRGLLAERAVTMIGGLPKAGKTTLVYSLAAALQRGDKDWCGLAIPKAAQCMILSEEDDDVLGSTFSTVGFDAANVPAVTRTSAFASGPRMSLSQYVDMALDVIKDRPDIKLFILDTWRGFAQFQENGENDASTVTKAFEPIKRLAASGVAVILIHHLRKSGGEDGTAFAGSAALMGEVDIMVELHRFGRGESNTMREIKATGRYQRIPPSTVIDYSEGTYRVIGDGDTSKKKIQQDKILKYLNECGRWVSTEEVRDGCKMGANVVKATLISMSELGLCQRIQGEPRKDSSLWAALNVKRPGRGTVSESESP